MNDNRLTRGLIVPYNELSPEALRGVVEEFVTRVALPYLGSKPLLISPRYI
jgi:hypothetical protein